MDYKVAIIPSDGKSIEYEYGIDENDRHADVLMRFGLNHYGKNSVFGLFDEDYNLTQYYLGAYGNVIFYNLAFDDDNKFGILYVLDDISSVQREKIFDLLATLKGYTVELDSFITTDGRLSMNDPFEEDYFEGFKKIKNYFNSISMGKVKRL